MDAPATSPAGKMPSYGIVENANNLTDVVLAAMAGAPDPRLREVMAAFVRHLHAFTREVQVTQDEYDLAIDFLNRIGKTTNDAHNEGILFADAVGFCRLVANRATPEGLGLHITGDPDRATVVLAAASTLALD